MTQTVCHRELESVEWTRVQVHCRISSHVDHQPIAAGCNDKGGTMCKLLPARVLVVKHIVVDETLQFR